MTRAGLGPLRRAARHPPAPHRSRTWPSLWWLVVGLVAACSPAPPPTNAGPSVRTPAPTALGPPIPDLVSSGDTTVTVLSRPSSDPMLPPPPRPRVVAATLSACRTAPACASVGRCSPAGNRCVAASYVDCRWVKGCVGGHCRIRDNQCEITSCAHSHGCSSEGLCAEKEGTCVVDTDAHCAASEACQKQGRCAAVEGRCVAATASHCRASDNCKQRGLCQLDGGACSAKSDSDCAASAACGRGVACHALNGRCATSCEKSDACARRGRCVAAPPQPGQPARCIANDEAQCERSDGCAARGQCSVMAGRCAAADNVDCGRSVLCLEQGKCTAKRGRCVALGDGECQRATVACGVEQRCVAAGGSCVKR